MRLKLPRTRGRRILLAVNQAIEIIDSQEGDSTFSWFKRGAQLLGYESRKLSTYAYELRIRLPNGSQRIEQFSATRRRCTTGK